MFPALLLTTLPMALGDPYKCNEPKSIRLTVDNPKYFFNYTEMEGSQDCTWNFTFPSNYMAEVRINTWFAYYDVLTVDSEWSVNSVQDIGFGGYYGGGENISLHVMWPPPYFEVELITSATSVMILDMNIVLKQLSIADKVPTQTFTTAVNQQPIFVQFTDWEEDTVITAKASSNGRLHLTSDAPNAETELYANIFVYSGSGSKLQLLGTLYSLISTLELRTFYTSSVASLTFYRAMGGEDTATLVINDYKNVKDFSFSLTWSPYNLANQSYEAHVEMIAITKAAALTVLNQADGSNAIYLERVEYVSCLGCVNDFYPVKLLAGGIIRDYNTSETYLGVYRDPASFDDQNYPQYLPGMARTFVLEQGHVKVHFTSAVTNTKETEAPDGRNGFVMSNNYPFMSQDQNSQDFVLNNVDGFTFEYTIDKQNPNKDAYLNFTVKELWDTDNFTLHDLEALATFNLTATEMKMTIIGGSAPSTGTLISYVIYNTTEFSGTTSTQSTTTEQQETTSNEGQVTVSSTEAEGTISTTEQVTTSTIQTTTTAQLANSTSSTIVFDAIFAGLASFLLLAAIIGTIVFLRYHIRRGKFRKFWAVMSAILPMTTKVDEWELGKKQLEVLEDKELGRGAFGIVFEGKLFGSRPVDKFVPKHLRVTERKIQVAVKRLLPNADLQSAFDFETEMEFMKKLGYHKHILGMIGCVTATSLPLIVLHLCENGDLLSWVRKHKHSLEELHSNQLLSIAFQISDGLCFLKRINLLHRDLAARNILLTQEMVAKISDFGLSREPGNTDDSETYLPQMYVSRGGRLPIKWMAPESLRDFQFSFKTDIWSFGVLLWEMFTFGDAPFSGVLPSALLELLESGERPPKGNIPHDIYDLMTSCWDAEPEKRETSEKMKDRLSEMSGNDYGYLVLSSEQHDIYENF